jgi:hypothetical protein
MRPIPPKKIGVNPERRRIVTRTTYFLFPEIPMTTQSWIRKLFTRGASRPIRKAAPWSTRLRLEQLEAREVPSISPLAPMADDGGDVVLEAGAGVAGLKNPSNPIGTTPVSNAANVNTDVIETNPARHNETSIAVNPTNPLNMVGAVNDIQLSVNPGGHLYEGGITRVRMTNDGGKSWTTLALVSNAYNFTGDPSVAFDASGTVYVATLGFRYNGGKSGTGIEPDVIVAHSTDDGTTWSQQLRVASGTGSFFSPGQGLDKEYIAAWGNGNAVVTWTQFNQGQKGSYISSTLYASVTHDGGNTWSKGVLISGSLLFNQGSVPTVAADGSVYVSFINGDLDVAADGFRDHYMVVKLDARTGQATGPAVDAGLVYDGIYDYPVSVDGRETYQDSQFRTWSLGNITADPTDAKHLALVWSDMRNNPYDGAFLPHAPNALPDPYAVQTNSDVIVSESLDGGKTWSPPTALPMAGDQFQPWSAFDRNGNLQIGFFDRSYDPANHLYGYTLATVGKTPLGDWGFHTQEISTALSDPTTGDRWSTVSVNPNFPNATRFMGDYSGIAVTPTGVAAFWTDMREDATFLGVTGHGQDAYFSLTKSLPSVSQADVDLGNLLIALAQWEATHKHS